MNAPRQYYLAAGVALLAVATGQLVSETSWADAQGEARIMTEQELREKVVGRRITNKDGYVIIHEDGTVTGAFGKGGRDKLTGTWTWEGQHYCRTLKVSGTDYGRDCQVIEVSGDMLASTTDQGQGERSVWKLDPVFEVPPATAEGEGRITTEQELREKVVGKRITNEDGHVVIHEDGTVTGAFGKGGRDKLTGTWTWEGQHYCRTLKVSGTDYGRDCQVIEVSGDTLASTTERGKGERSVWKLE